MIRALSRSGPLSPAEERSLDTAAHFAADVRLLTTPEDLDALLATTSKTLGFDYHALVMHGPLPAARAAGLVLTNYPADWQARFADQDLWRVDPVQQACRITVLGFEWSSLPRLLAMTPRQRSLLEESRHYGLRQGFTVPLHLPGMRMSSCSFARATQRDLPATTLLEAQLVGQIAFDALLRLRGGGGEPIRLSPRQRDCVALSAAGLTDRGIARRLSLSEETVTKYLNAARRRCGASRRAQLVAAALRDGLISFDEIEAG